MDANKLSQLWHNFIIYPIKDPEEKRQNLAKLLDICICFFAAQQTAAAKPTDDDDDDRRISSLGFNTRYCIGNWLIHQFIIDIGTSASRRSRQASAFECEYTFLSDYFLDDIGWKLLKSIYHFNSNDTLLYNVAFIQLLVPILKQFLSAHLLDSIDDSGELTVASKFVNLKKRDGDCGAHQDCLIESFSECSKCYEIAKKQPPELTFGDRSDPDNIDDDALLSPAKVKSWIRRSRERVGTFAPFSSSSSNSKNSRCNKLRRLPNNKQQSNNQHSRWRSHRNNAITSDYCDSDDDDDADDRGHHLNINGANNIDDNDEDEDDDEDSDSRTRSHLILSTHRGHYTKYGTINAGRLIVEATKLSPIELPNELSSVHRSLITGDHGGDNDDDDANGRALREPTRNDIIAMIVQILIDFVRYEHRFVEVENSRESKIVSPSTRLETFSDFSRNNHNNNNNDNYRTNTSSTTTISAGKLSLFVIEEFAPIMGRIVATSSSNRRIEAKLALLRPIQNLIITATFTACRTSAGVTLIARYCVMENLLKLLRQVDSHIKNRREEDDESNDQVPFSGASDNNNNLGIILRLEFYDIMRCAVTTLLEMGKYLCDTKQFDIFAGMTGAFFHENNHELLQSLVAICETFHREDSAPPPTIVVVDRECSDYSFVYRIIDLLLQLQFALQYSQSVCAHKLVCAKRRHKNCDLIPFMVHHVYHERMFASDFHASSSASNPLSSSSSSSSSSGCVISAIYNVLVNLIFICAKRPASDAVDRLICHICDRLASLITCCWPLRTHFNRLLHFAVNRERSNAIRSSIFAIIERNIRRQRRSPHRGSHIYEADHYSGHSRRHSLRYPDCDPPASIEKCNYCERENLTRDSGVCGENNNGTDEHSLQPHHHHHHHHNITSDSEGYLTDHSNVTGAAAAAAATSATTTTTTTAITTAAPTNSSIKNLESNRNSAHPNRSRLAESCSHSNCLIASLSGHYISLLKSESRPIRQTIFRHLLNLFSYLSNDSKLSLLRHIVFPVMQAASQFSPDVCTFTLRLLIYIADRRDDFAAAAAAPTSSTTNYKNSLQEAKNDEVEEETEELNLLSAFKKINGFVLIKKLILNDAENDVYDTEDDDDDRETKRPQHSRHENLSFLAIRLLESLIINEIDSVERAVGIEPIGSCALPLRSIPLFISLFVDHFTDRKRLASAGIPALVEMDSASPDDNHLSLDYWRTISFNFAQINDQTSGAKLDGYLLTLLRLLTTCNTILRRHDSFRILLCDAAAHSTRAPRFAETMYQFFQHFFQLVLNEMRLYRLLRNSISATKATSPKAIDSIKYGTFFAKLFRIVEQLLLLLLQIEPFRVGSDDRACSSTDICEVINRKLQFLITETAPVDDMGQDLLKMLINLAFNDSAPRDLRRFINCLDIEDSIDLENYFTNTTTTTTTTTTTFSKAGSDEKLITGSSDSLILTGSNDDDEALGKSVSQIEPFDEYDAGYLADTESSSSQPQQQQQQKQPAMISGSFQSPAADRFSKSKYFSTSTKNISLQCGPASPLLKHIDLCKTVILFLARALRKSSKSKSSSASTIMQKFDLDSALPIVNIVTKNCRENAHNCRLLYENDFTTLLMREFGDTLVSPLAEHRAMRCAIFDLFIEICHVQFGARELRLLIDLFKHDAVDYDFLITTTQKILFAKHTDPMQPLYSVSFPVAAAKSRPNESVRKATSWIDSILSRIRSEANDEQQQPAAQPKPTLSSSVRNGNESAISFTSAAAALPLANTHIHNYHFSIAFWIYLDKINPLIDKYKVASSASMPAESASSLVRDRSPKNDSKLGTRETAENVAEHRSRNVKCVHICSMAFNSSTIELWFDYIYNRFVYRVCKLTAGKLVYCGENFILNHAAICGKWNFIRVNIEQIAALKSRNQFCRISHSANCAKDETIRLTFPANLLDKNYRDCALLLGATTTTNATMPNDVDNFRYKLGNLFLFNQHLEASTSVFLYSLGADFGSLHHLRHDSIVKDNYFVLPKQLTQQRENTAGGTDVIASMHQCISPAVESKLILKYLILLYRANTPEVYFTYASAGAAAGAGISPTTIPKSAKSLVVAPFSRFYPPSISAQSIASLSSSSSVFSAPSNVRSGKAQRSDRIADLRSFSAKYFADIKRESHFGVAKTIADCGGISLFIFMLCYMCERATNDRRKPKNRSQPVSTKIGAIQHKALELLLRVYESAYQHRFAFDTHYAGHRVVLYALERSLISAEKQRKSLSATTYVALWRVFAQFTLDTSLAGHTIISSNLDLLLRSWRVWCRCAASMRQYFGKLQCLIVATNPYRAYNLAQLRKANAFSRLLTMLIDMYIDCDAADHRPRKSNHLGSDENYNHIDRDLVVIEDDTDDDEDGGAAAAGGGGGGDCDKVDDDDDSDSAADILGLDCESLTNVISILNAIMDSHIDLSLFKRVFDCLLILQKTELLHVNQTRSSFYYLFPSTWLITTRIRESQPVSASSLDSAAAKVNIAAAAISTTANGGIDSANHHHHHHNQEQQRPSSENMPDMTEWEIVSEMLDNCALFDSSCDLDDNREAINSGSGSKCANNRRNDGRDAVVIRLLQLIIRFVDQLSDEITLIDAIFERVLCLDLLLAFVNTPSDRVREMALRTFFKFFNLYYRRQSTNAANRSVDLLPRHSDENASANGAKIIIKNRTLDLLLLANQLYPHVATEECALLSIGFLLDLNRQSTVELFEAYDTGSAVLRKALQRISLENFIPFLALLPKCCGGRSTSAIAFAHKCAAMLHRILAALPIERLAELQRDYGLAQSLSKLIINLNHQSSSSSPLSFSSTKISAAEDCMNGCTREQVNDQVAKIFYDLAQRFVRRTGALYAQCFADLSYYLSIMERKVAPTVTPTFREAQISLFRAAFDVLIPLKNENNNNTANNIGDLGNVGDNPDSLDLLSEQQFFQLFTGNEIMISDYSHDYVPPRPPQSINANAPIAVPIVDTRREMLQQEKDCLKPKEAFERIKLVIDKSTSFIIGRDEVRLTQKEMYFQRELLYHLLDIVECAESGNIQRSSSTGAFSRRNRKVKRNAFSNVIYANRDFFKSHLTQVLLFLTSPFQAISDRIFAFNLFTEKTKIFDFVKHFVVESSARSERAAGGGGNEKFVYLFEAFLADLLDKGITDLAIQNLLHNKNLEQFPAAFQHHSIESSLSDGNSNRESHQSIESLLTKFRRQLNMITPRSAQFYKQQIANWCEQLECNKRAHESSVRRNVSNIFANMSIVHQQVSNAATGLNDKAIFAQHEQKKRYIEHLRAQSLARQKVRSHLAALIAESMHERSFWHIAQYYPQSWSLCPFESRNRIRRKLERNFLDIDSRYVRSSLATENRKSLCGKNLFPTLLGADCLNPFAGGFETDDCLFFDGIDGASLSSSSTSSSSSGYGKNERNPKSNPAASQLLYTTTARVILFDEEIEGEILIKNNCIQFFANQSEAESGSKSGGNKKLSTLNRKSASFRDLVISFSEITELFDCRYELQHNAVEIYLDCGLTHLIAFESTAIRDEFVRTLTANREALPNLTEKCNLVTLTQLWRDRRITNFEYLTHLNKLSGRTSNDLMQYPVFPFVLADYQSDVINLRDPSSFRIFSRPIAVQRKERERHYVEQYEYIKAENERHTARSADAAGLGGNGALNAMNSFQFVVTSAPYHYGSHYSNSGIVLHYLVRLPPYTQMFLQYQDKNFDIPDRTFHSMHTTWRLATEDSTNGFKELIPEFFCLPEFLRNTERFDLGTRQNGERVDDVILPPYARGDARLFTLINRQALESNYATQHLHQWIDLIFGYQQSGKAAIDACNVFHPATHFSADVSKIEDDVKRQAIKTMIRTFGQMPNQLFNMPHPAISAEATLPAEDDIQLVAASMPEVIGLKWGDYVGSPLYPKPVLCFQKKFRSSRIARICALPTHDLLLLPADASLMVWYNQRRDAFLNTLYIVNYSLCTWSRVDRTVWIKSKDDQFLFTHENQFLDKICICESIPDFDRLLIGYESGLIVAFSLNPLKNMMNAVGLKKRHSLLVGHRAPISTISMNKNYSIAISGDADGVCIMWDMSKLQYVRTICATTSGSIALTCISDTLGDLAIIDYCYDSFHFGVQQQRQQPLSVIGSRLRVFTINGQAVGEIVTGNGRNEPDEAYCYITALCYSTCAEGLAINTIAAGLSNGAIKMWSSWDLTLIRQIKMTGMSIPIKCLSFSFANDLLYIVLADDLLVVLENAGSSSASVSASGSQISASNSAAASSAAANVSNRKNFRLLDLTYLN